MALWIILGIGLGIVCVGFLWDLIDKAIDLYQNRTINERIKQYQADKESELRHLNQNILHATEELERQTSLLQLDESSIRQLRENNKKLLSQLSEEQRQIKKAQEEGYSYYLDLLDNLYTKESHEYIWQVRSPYMNRNNESLKLEAEASISRQLMRAKEELDKLREDILQGIPSTIKRIAYLYAEVKGRMYDIHSNNLIKKSHPAYGTATEVRDILKKEIKEVTKKWKEAQLNYEVLKATIEKEVSDDIDYEEIEIETTEDDKTERDWLSKEEYEQLDDMQRSALALERYIKRNKTKRQIGRDYEEYIAYLFRTYRGFSRSYIYMQGQIKGLEDLGRDIIVKNKNKIYIVQCKRWSRERRIRENAIMQLFGTVCEYCLEHRLNPMNVIGSSVFAIFCTTTELSETAMRFAKVLKIQVYNVPQEEFPRIKCNVGQNGEKIYHLPFDQQYNSIIIESNKGEKLVWTPQEAEQEGFRRAKRHIY